MSCKSSIREKSAMKLSQSVQQIFQFSLMLLALASTLLMAQNTNDQKWVGTWATAPYAADNNTPPSPYLANNTLRQIVRTSIAGDTLRVKFSNRTCSTPVTMNSVNIAVSTDGGTSVIDASTITELKFNGEESVTMDAYSEVTSDPVAFPLTPGEILAITIYYGECKTSPDMTFHYGSRTDSYILTGDQTTSADFAGATVVERWYNLSSIDVLAEPETATVSVLGNSITDGYGVHGCPMNRWTQFFSDKLLKNSATEHVGVLNLGIGATTVIGSGIGRFQQDVLDQAGLRWIIVFYGVNDIGANQPADKIIAAFKTLISQAHSQNIRIYGATITPFKGHYYYSEAHEAVRNEVNEWIRTPGNFDKCIDFDKAIRDPSDTLKLQAAYSNDWLHPNAAGYQFLGESVDVNLFLGADTVYQQPVFESHYFEPECATIGENWDILPDTQASNALYVTVKTGIQSLNTAPTDSASAIYIPFSVDTSDNFTVYAVVNCPTFDDDSFWAKVDNGDFIMYNGLSNSGWQWVQLGSYDLAEGEHIFTITYREDGAKLDKICISNNTAVPTGLGEVAENICDVTSVENPSEVQTDYELGQNYPNPFNPATTIEYLVPVSSRITLKVYDILGNEVATLFEGKQNAGTYDASFDGSALSSGVYFYQMRSENFTGTKKLLLIK